MHVSLFSSPNNRKHTNARSTPTFSHLLLNNRKRQDLKSCSVALCAITFQLQPCFPRNCAPLEQKNRCPAIEKHPFPGQKTAIVANFFVFVWCICYLMLYFPICWYNFNPIDLYKKSITQHIKWFASQGTSLYSIYHYILELLLRWCILFKMTLRFV